MRQRPPGSIQGEIWDKAPVRAGIHLEVRVTPQVFQAFREHAAHPMRIGFQPRWVTGGIAKLYPRRWHRVKCFIDGPLNFGAFHHGVMKFLFLFFALLITPLFADGLQTLQGLGPRSLHLWHPNED